MYFGDQVKNLGYKEYYPVETMDTEGFERSNYFGYEDDVMLKPSEEWLKKRDDNPFVAEYLTSTGHHDYFPHALQARRLRRGRQAQSLPQLRPLPGLLFEEPHRAVQAGALREYDVHNLRRSRGGLRRARPLRAKTTPTRRVLRSRSSSTPPGASSTARGSRNYRT